LNMCGWARLAETVGLLDAYVETVPDGSDELAAQGSGGGHEYAERAKVVVCDGRRFGER
jgi:hypothetical protein